MLSELGPEEFCERWAAYELDGWGDDWRHTYTIVAGVFNAVREVFGNTDYLGADDFLEGPKERKPRDDFEQQARSRYG